MSELQETLKLFSSWLEEQQAFDRDKDILPQTEPGELLQKLRAFSFGKEALGLREIWGLCEKELLPYATHWNHPHYFGYFAISATTPAVLAECLCSALNQQAMLWKTSPLATELEAYILEELAHKMGLGDHFTGITFSGASTSTFHALATALYIKFPELREEGIASVARRYRIYITPYTHNSIHKATMLLGLGLNSLVEIPCGQDDGMDPKALQEQILKDRQEGFTPLAVVATLGTTSIASLDPVGAIQKVCQENEVWLHIDAAYGGAVALLPEKKAWFEGWERADSVVFNPHKWLFTPMDCSILWTSKKVDPARVFSLKASYLDSDDPEKPYNLMDRSMPLGRKFRALKMWWLIQYYGWEGIRERLRSHMEIAQSMAAKIEASSDWNLMASCHLSLVVLRAQPKSISSDRWDELNEEVCRRVNATRKFFLAGARHQGDWVIRVAFGHVEAQMEDEARIWNALEKALKEVIAEWASPVAN